MVRAGIEPATHGFSVRARPNEFVGKNESGGKWVQKRVQSGAGDNATKTELSRALDELIALWPNLSLATQNRIYELAISQTSEKSV